MCYGGGCDHREREGPIMKAWGVPEFQRDREGGPAEETGPGPAEGEAGVRRAGRTSWSGQPEWSDAMDRSNWTKACTFLAIRTLGICAGDGSAQHGRLLLGCQGVEVLRGGSEAYECK